jgi:hypothetical protein
MRTHIIVLVIKHSRNHTDCRYFKITPKQIHGLLITDWHTATQEARSYPSFCVCMPPTIAVTTGYDEAAAERLPRDVSVRQKAFELMEG